jgi:hypothetical protein
MASQGRVVPESADGLDPSGSNRLAEGRSPVGPRDRELVDQFA